MRKIIIIIGGVIVIFLLGYLLTTGLVWLAIKGYEIGFNTSLDWNIWGVGLLTYIVTLVISSFFSK